MIWSGTAHQSVQRDFVRLTDASKLQDSSGGRSQDLGVSRNEIAPPFELAKALRVGRFNTRSVSKAVNPPTCSRLQVLGGCTDRRMLISPMTRFRASFWICQIYEES